MDALIAVDIQNDFLPGGALAVPRGDEVIAIVNGLMPRADLVVATQDWHPPDHLSFASQHPGRQVGDVIDLDGIEQVLWPDHCVQGTPGAALADALDTTRISEVFRKGSDRRVDSYSGFYDNGRRHATGLADYLRQRGVTRVWVCGLATDYCVKYTALDALREGLATCVVEDACRGVEVRPGDVAAAWDEMRRAGAQVARSADMRHG